jgi:hypothetical protein
VCNGKKLNVNEEKTDSLFQTPPKKEEASSSSLSLSSRARAHRQKKNTNKYKVLGAGW